MKLRHWVVIFAALTLAASPLAAQSNSLFRHNRGEVTRAAPRPMQPMTPAASASATPVARPAVAGEAVAAEGGASAMTGGAAPVNPTLMHTSLIAVSVPAPQRIGVHDLLTIVVREDKRATSDSKLQSDKEWKLDGALEQWLRLDTRDRLVPQNFRAAPGARFDFKNEYDGTGKVDRKDSLITRVTATVIDVKPNGNLVLEARKSIKTDEEVQVVTLTGTCRARDVTADNTVLSTQVADMQITVEHSGAARDAARRGWLMKAFDFLRPL